MKHLIIFFVLITSALFAQNITITGKIVDQNGEPLPLTNITIESTNYGVTSDSEGTFVISGDFKENDVVRFSYIGYETITKTISDLSSIDKPVITLEKKILTSQTVLVKSSILRKGESPISFSKLDREEIEDNYVTQDIPEILSYLPSTTFYSEGGAGLGYNYLSIRGFDQRRISISINGVPQNDPEDHNVYWLDFPDLLESTELIQVQRGAGSGVVGYPAIGGSINIITSPFSDEPKFELSTLYGSYNTRKYSASFASGLINKKYSLYAKVSHLLSDGYRDDNWVDFKSYHISAVRYDEDVTTQLNVFGGPIADGLTYTGLPKFAIKDRDLRRDNFSYWEATENEYAYTLERKTTEIENFSQPHFELLNEFQLSDDVTLNSTLFLVIGQGFFDFDGSWADTSYLRLTNEFGFQPAQNPGNVLIRAKVENNQWGWLPRARIAHSNGELILGGEVRVHRSLHWGSANFGENLPAGLTKDYRYYRYKGGKDIFNFYFHENYMFSDKINLLAETQLAYHKYYLYDEKYVGTDFGIDDLFINPRVGLNYKFNDNFNSYISFARVSREPRLKTYYDAAESSGGEVPQFEQDASGNYDFENPLVKPETMNSFEIGSSYNSENISLTANAFYMLFNDEIVSQGQVDRFGQPITGNVESTVHAGMELNGTIKISENFSFTANGSYSKNYIQKGKYFIDDQSFIDLADNRISGFPDITFNAIADIRYEGFEGKVLAKYVGEFYSDNYDENLNEYLDDNPGFVDYADNKVDAYFTMNLLLKYSFQLQPFFNNVKIFLQINNLFDNLYAAYAIGKEFFPAAERHFMGGIEVNL